MCSSDENKDRELIEEMNANYEEALCQSPFPGAAGEGEGHGDEEVHLPGAWIALVRKSNPTTCCRVGRSYPSKVVQDIENCSPVMKIPTKKLI